MSLLAVDLGLRTGLALYGRDGRLQWYRSSNFGTTSRLKRGVRSVLAEIPDLTHLVMEGGGSIADIWEAAALYHAVEIQQISAETWRTVLFLPRQQRKGKDSADEMARQVIAWSGAARPTSLRHDAAEAILIGLWGVLAVGWLAELPAALKR